MLQYLIKGSLKEAAEVGGKRALKASVDQHLTKLKFNKSPIGRRGQSLNMRAFGLHERQIDPLITNKELDMKWDEVMGEGTRIFDGEEYKFQPGSTELTKPSNISPGGQRTLMTKKLSQMKAGKSSVNVNRKKHYDYMKKNHPEWVEDYTAKNAQATMLNKHEAERRIAQGEKVPNKPQYVMFEHNTAIRSPRWDNIKGANVPWNTFVNRNPRARFFKDGLESFFYTHIKKRGNNWDLRTNLGNQKDIEVMEISTGKLLFTIPFPEEFVIGESFTKYVSKASILKDLKKNATGYKG